jgi:hypothetical protein
MFPFLLPEPQYWASKDKKNNCPSSGNENRQALFKKNKKKTV